MPQLLSDLATPTEPYAPKTAWQQGFLSNTEWDVFSLPLYERLVAGPMFIAVAMGMIDVNAVLEAYREKLWRGGITESRPPGKRWWTTHRQLLFELQPDLHLWVNSNISCCRVFARDESLAQKTAREISDRFRVRKRTQKHPPTFHLIAFGDRGIRATAVEVDRSAELDREDLSLLYGDDFTTWDSSFQAQLTSGRSGAAILRGLPGTGKTTYIRHLITRNATKVRFYFLPSTNFSLLSSPRLVEFWSAEARLLPSQPLVVIIEDAESLLADRAGGDNGHVGDMLNIADGLLGDFLKLKVLCTINCPLEKLDPAITRSGRLIAAREFNRVDRDRALRIAARRQLVLTEQADYSLAEIFRGQRKLSVDPKRAMGFACRPMFSVPTAGC